jgi:hydrogenase/urease accessory protein HupE
MNKYKARIPKFETHSNVNKLESLSTTLFWNFSLIRNFNLFRVSNFVFNILLFLFVPSYANAHLVTTGMGPVYDGIGHLLLTPEDLVPVLTLALYAGMRGAVAGRWTMFLLPTAWFIGGIAGAAWDITTTLPIPAISFLILGGLVAADFCVPASAVAGLVIVVGFVHGILNGAVLQDGAGTLGLVGIMTMLFVIVTLTSAFVVSLKKAWARIAVRVAGSWVASIGLLMFGWAMR